MGRRPDPLFWCIIFISITFAAISIVAAIATVILSII